MGNIIDMTGKKIIITGASSGIGRQAAITLSELGATCILIARREEELVKTMEQMTGEGHSYYLLDLGNPDNVEPMFNQIYEEQGAVDGMVYSAGISKTQPLKMRNPEKIHETMDINFVSFMECCRMITKKKRFNPNTSIVGVSSIAAQDFRVKGIQLYAASKAAMNALVCSLAVELKDKGIRINSVMPTNTNTPMTMQYRQMLGDNQYENYADWLEPIEVVNNIVFLLSSAASGVTGECIALHR